MSGGIRYTNQRLLIWTSANPPLGTGSRLHVQQRVESAFFYPPITVAHIHSYATAYILQRHTFLYVLYMPVILTNVVTGFSCFKHTQTVLVLVLSAERGSKELIDTRKPLLDQVDKMPPWPSDEVRAQIELVQKNWKLIVHPTVLQ